MPNDRVTEQRLKAAKTRELVRTRVPPFCVFLTLRHLNKCFRQIRHIGGLVLHATCLSVKCCDWRGVLRVKRWTVWRSQFLSLLADAASEIVNLLPKSARARRKVHHGRN
ncbi:hypothetical protein V5799_014365 [Amblyomma americanum]|uniref:Uncharacterized protein n=1 Tax=Amblyomma americanum TaxID=6943 RepID=A0AAQ4E395_AMBAM